MNLEKRIQRLEQQAILADQEFFGSCSEEELWFFVVHGYYPEMADCTDEPRVRQLEYAGFRVTIILERATCVSKPIEVCKPQG